MIVDMDDGRFVVAGFARYGGAKKILSGAELEPGVPLKKKQISQGEFRQPT
jgi:hypothetical protein